MDSACCCGCARQHQQGHRVKVKERELQRSEGHHTVNCQRQGKTGIRDVGSISNLGARHFEGTSFLKKKGAFLKIKRALLCLLQNLGGHVPPVPTFMTRIYSCSKNPQNKNHLFQNCLFCFPFKDEEFLMRRYNFSTKSV